MRLKTVSLSKFVANHDRYPSNNQFTGKVSVIILEYLSPQDNGTHDSDSDYWYFIEQFYPQYQA